MGHTHSGPVGDHVQVVKEFAHEMAPVMDGSRQAMMLYLDDQHKACNQKLADYLGYTVDEFNASDGVMVETFVAAEDRERFTTEFGENFADKKNAYATTIAVLRKDGTRGKIDMFIVPVMYQGHLFAVQYGTLHP